MLLIGMAFRKMAAVTSFGKPTKTGLSRPLVAISKASFILFGNSATFLTITFHFVHALEMRTISALGPLIFGPLTPCLKVHP